MVCASSRITCKLFYLNVRSLLLLLFHVRDLKRSPTLSLTSSQQILYKSSDVCVRERRERGKTERRKKERHNTYFTFVGMKVQREREKERERERKRERERERGREREPFSTMTTHINRSCDWSAKSGTVS